jgi:hypothetical protein
MTAVNHFYLHLSEPDTVQHLIYNVWIISICPIHNRTICGSQRMRLGGVWSAHVHTRVVLSLQILIQNLKLKLDFAFSPS